MQNQYQSGDFVLFQLNPNDLLPSKLSPKVLGPFKMMSNAKTWYMGPTYHVERLKLFHDSFNEAVEMARIDNDQYVIEKFVAYRGYPMVRTTMKFEVKFADESIQWLPWSNDLFATVQYEDLLPYSYSFADSPLMAMTQGTHTSLVVDDFLIKFRLQENADNLVAALSYRGRLGRFTILGHD